MARSIGHRGVTAATRAGRADIAVVGMACRFPGARDLNQYWRLLTDPAPQFAAVPDSRWRAAAFRSDNFRDAAAGYTDTMALLPEVGHFDAAHYGIPPRRARSMDPQHRLLIDLAREAIQDAGWEAGGFDREETSVIASLTDSGYRDISAMQIRVRQLAGGEFGARGDSARLLESARAVDGLHGTSVAGLLLNMGPSTISSVFDLHGESYALDAACSGGLLAVANAVYALRAGRSRIAIAGGAQLVLTPDLLVGLCRIGAISRSGRCLPFGAAADGFVLGEGAGVLVLRPLEDALAAGDRVYAVIRGVGTANDGTVQGGLHPQAAGQLRALRRAYRDAGLEPGAVGYLEAHGTGTTVGDPVEIGVLAELRGEHAPPAHLGAVKAVVGHSLNAAGLAGLIKTVLAVHRGVIPPQPAFELADHSRLDAAALTIATGPTAWPDAGQRRRAGVSAFGFGGTGVHLVLEQAPAVPAPAHAPGPHRLVLHARDTAGLARHARELARALAEDRPPLAAVASTLAQRAPLTERLTLRAADLTEAVARLTEAAEGRPAADHGPAADTPRTPPCTLPPSPLAPRHHWVVDTTARDVTEQAVPLRKAEAAPAAPGTGGTSAAAVVLEEVSRTGVFPLSELAPQQSLVADLGFDSLMVQELAANLGRRIPGFQPEHLYAPGRTIGELITLAAPYSGEQAVPYTPSFPRQRDAAWAAAAPADDFPEIREFEERLGAIKASGARFPYFRVHEGTIRDTTVIDGRPYLSFGSYNYLGLSGHPAVGRAVHEAVDRYGTSVSASRVLSGERELTVRLERALAEFLGVPDCLALVSGHATNVTAIGHLLGPGDLVLHDALAHDSILQGCTLSGAARRPFVHNDTGQLEHLLRANRHRFRRVPIAVEGAYSMDGDLVDLPAVIELKKRYGALLMVDEAHSIGTVGAGGRGVGEFFGVDRADVDLWMGTLSKAFASCGGYLGGSARLVRWLRHTLPGFVYSVGLTPANAAAALAATELITPERVGALHRNAELFLGLATAAGLATGTSAHTPIVPCLLGDSARTLLVADRLYARGLIADPIFHPAVEEGLSRLRFFVTADHRETDIRRAVALLAEEVAQALV
ncbi:aminotransferase class I/II-fold pyridoxal phosphate-dependent enzyme [Kitasatospora sp. NPDC002227]|uniref:aminotransferase class I/II-fold pyridoxal phosphate-dependent enzyme n=1 Tax=Kitasatospora sp. NPDC002227 TaxID=3154773 RepID=UPI00332DCDBE